MRTNMTAESIRQYYGEKACALEGRLRRLRRRSRAFVAAELASFVAALGLLGVYATVGEGLAAAAAGVMLCVYLGVRRSDAACAALIERLEGLLGVYRDELCALRGDFSPFADGAKYADPGHAFSIDMDLFGPLSLYNRLCRTATDGGSELLAEWLGGLPLAVGEGGKRRIDRRREAISRLAEMEDLRSEFIAMGRKGRLDTAGVKALLADVGALRLPSFASSRAAGVAAWASVAALMALSLLAMLTPLSANVAVGWAVVQLAAAYSLCARPLREAGRAAERLNKQMKTYAEMVSLAATTELNAVDDPELPTLREGESAEAVEAFAELRRILAAIDRRGNILGLLLSDALFLSDVLLVRRFARWQRLHLRLIGRWIDRLSVLDALVSMATFRYNHPQTADAVILEGEEITFNALQLGHPFLGAKAVGNDFSIAHGQYYIITGANMAGKSTFLRSVGINYILAANGLPVFAKSLETTLFGLFSSMRTTDDLGHGISYFNAELRRLKLLLDRCRASKATLIILDEILRGTNSLDKLNGSRMFLEAIAPLSVSGLIATHDLELSKMADERPETFHNWCFEIELTDDVTYTYKISPGVARNQNATFLLRNMIGITPGNAEAQP